MGVAEPRGYWRRMRVVVRVCGSAVGSMGAAMCGRVAGTRACLLPQVRGGVAHAGAVRRWMRFM